MEIRLSKLMSQRGLCSRREADSYIERGWVFVDGDRVTELGTRSPDEQHHAWPATRRRSSRHARTILLNKPVGYVSGQAEPAYQPAVVPDQGRTRNRATDRP